MDSEDDIIKGRRLTNAESMHLILPDFHLVDDKIFEEVLRPFMVNKDKEDLK